MCSEKLAAYLARIGLATPLPRDAGGLEAVLRAHRGAIGFENFDVMLGRGVAVDADAVFDKLVRRGRGGYCFEHNGLFGAMLEALGFANRALMARVWLAAEEGITPMRGHTLRLVDLGGEPWIADAGFGGAFAPVMPLRDGAEAQTPDGARHRLRMMGALGDLDGQWMLERLGPLGATDGRAQSEGQWSPQYSFDLAQVAPIDIAMASHWVSTKAGARFTSLRIGSIVLPDGFVALTDRRLRVYAAGRVEERDLASAAEWRAVVRDLLRIELSAQEAEALFG
jgi:N-hydroxyarylamine O-acetyltransferase